MDISKRVERQNQKLNTLKKSVNSGELVQPSSTYIQQYDKQLIRNKDITVDGKKAMLLKGCKLVGGAT